MTSIKQIQTNLTLLCAVLTLSLLAACSSDDDGDGPPTGNGTDVEVIDFTPNSAFVGDEVQIDGLGFSANAGENQIWFNDTQATTDSVSLSEGSDSGTLFTTVPEGATTGPIAVSVNGGDRAESSADFTVEEPDGQEGGEEFATLYWTGTHGRSNGGNDHAVIGTSYIDGQGRRHSELVYNFYNSESGEYLMDKYQVGIALDLNEEMIYWTNGVEGLVLRAPMNGSGPADADTLYHTAAEYATGLAIDLEARDIFWVSGTDLLKGSMDGSAPVDTLYDASDGIGWGNYMDFYIEDEMFYWTDFGDFVTASVSHAPKDGSGPVEVLYELDSSTIYDLVIDQEAGDLYIGDGGDDARILKGSVDGSQSLELLYQGAEHNVSNPTVALDQQRGYLYWSQVSSTVGNGGIIMRGRADGSGEIEQGYDLRGLSSENGDGIYGIYGMAVVPEPGSAKAKGRGYIPPVYLKF